MYFFLKNSVYLAFIGMALGLVSSAFSQSVMDNIRPVGQVCTNADACTQIEPSDNDNPRSEENIDKVKSSGCLLWGSSGCCLIRTKHSMQQAAV